jgi:hypothetical protein
MADSTNDVPSAFKANNKWICGNIEKLRQQYDNQWVAVLDQAVVDSGPDLRKLVDRLKAKHSNVYAKIAVEYVTAAEKEETDMDSPETIEHYL